MTRIRIAVIGSGGQLGSDLVHVLGCCGEYEVAALTRDNIDCTSIESVRKVLAAFRPDVVINCAAFVRVDDCEDEPGEAFSVNAIGALNIGRACADQAALPVYVSTDYVFDGTKGEAYTERDRVHPVNVYGTSKLAGELLLQGACGKWLIARTASLFGKRGSRGKGSNFVETILRKAREGAPLRVVDDIRMSPTYTLDFAHALAHLIRSQATGITHVVNRGSCTWFEFAQAALRAAGVERRIEPVQSSAFPMRARRPADSSLTSVHIDAAASEWLRPWPDALRAYMAERTNS